MANLNPETLSMLGFQKGQRFSKDRPRAFDHERLSIRAAGEDAISSNRVAVLMLAGGSSTRINGALRLGLSIGPVSDRTILQLQLEKILAVQTRFQVQVPLIVLTNEDTHERVIRLFEEHEYGGLNQTGVEFIVQPSLPVFDAEGRTVQTQAGTILKAPAGHGSAFSAIRDNDVSKKLLDTGRDIMFCFQHPNVMEQICDPYLIGAHLAGGFEATVKSIVDAKFGEKVGRLVLNEAGSIQILEYTELGSDTKLGWVLSNPINIGTYVWNVSFLSRCIEDEVELPATIVRHRISTSDLELWKSEQFIFDLLNYARSTGFIQVPRSEHYAVVKYPTGEDSIASAQKKLCQLYRSWLEYAGATPATDGAQVEVSPLFALDKEELANKIKPGFVYHNGALL